MLLARRLAFVALLLLSVSLRPAVAQFSKATVLLIGKVTDTETGAALRAHISFIDPSGAEVNKATTNALGTYQAVLKPGTSCTAVVRSSKHYTVSEPLSFPASDKSQQATHDMSLKPIHAGEVMFSDLCFDRGSVVPRDGAASAVARVGQAMRQNEEIEVSVETFSDDVIDGAPVAADQGTQRSEALKKILLTNGAAPNRVATNAHNPPPAAPEEPITGKKKKKAKAAKKKPMKKAARGKKGKAPEPQASKATITISTVHSDDE